MSVSSYCSPNTPVFSYFLQICNSSSLISHLLTVSFFYLLFFYPTSFLLMYHAAIHHAVTHNPSIYVYGTTVSNIFLSSSAISLFRSLTVISLFNFLNSHTQSLFQLVTLGLGLVLQLVLIFMRFSRGFKPSKNIKQTKENE